MALDFKHETEPFGNLFTTLGEVDERTLFEVADTDDRRNGWIGFTFSAEISDGKPKFVILFTHEYNNDGFEWGLVKWDECVRVRKLRPNEVLKLRNQG